MPSQTIKAMLDKCEEIATGHRAAQRLFAYLAVIAQISTSDEEAGQMLADHVSEKGDDLNVWIGAHHDLIETVLTDWYSAARLHEQKRGVTK